MPEIKEHAGPEIMGGAFHADIMARLLITKAKYIVHG